jgi:hypothetical protein
LEVPAPPSRTLVASTAEPEPPPPAATPATGAPPAARPAEPPPPARTAPPPATPPATPPTTPATEVPPPQNPAAAAMENRVRGVLTEVDRLLTNVVVEQLSREARDHYNTAVSHLRQAREALSVYKNVVYAQELADRALTLAKQLGKSLLSATSTSPSTPPTALRGW